MNQFSLAEKVIVVTGAAGLLGVNHVEAIASAGGQPVMLDKDKNRLEKTAKEIGKKFSTQIPFFELDITDADQVEKCCNEVMHTFGHIDGLINNAANNPKIETAEVNSDSRLETFNMNRWDADIAVGLTGSLLCTKYFGAQIAKQGGSIVNVSSDLGIIAPDQRIYHKDGTPPNRQPVKAVSYSVVKTGLIGLTRYTATYWADKKVRCNALCPGGIENNQESSFVAKLSELIPLGRMAQQDEYKGSIIFLLSDASSYLTGQTLIADGGRSAW